MRLAPRSTQLHSQGRRHVSLTTRHIRTSGAGKGEGDPLCLTGRAALLLDADAGKVDAAPLADLIAADTHRRSLQLTGTFDRSPAAARIDPASRAEIRDELDTLAALWAPYTSSRAHNHALYVWAYERSLQRVAVLASRADPEDAARDLVDELGLRDALLDEREVLHARALYRADCGEAGDALLGQAPQRRSVLEVAALGDRHGVPVDEVLVARMRLLDQAGQLARLRPGDRELAGLVDGQMARVKVTADVLDGMLAEELALRQRGDVDAGAYVTFDLGDARSKALITGVLASSLRGDQRQERLKTVNEQMRLAAQLTAEDLQLTRPASSQTVSTEVWATYYALFPPHIDPRQVPGVFYPYDQMMVLSPAQSQEVIDLAHVGAGARTSFSGGQLHELGHASCRNARGVARRLRAGGLRSARRTVPPARRAACRRSPRGGRGPDAVRRPGRLPGRRRRAGDDGPSAARRARLG